MDSNYSLEKNKPVDVLWKIFSSTEFKNKFITASGTISSISNEDYVDLLYKTILNRNPDSISKVALINSLKTSTSRYVLFTRVLMSKESTIKNPALFKDAILTTESVSPVVPLPPIIPNPPVPAKPFDIVGYLDGVNSNYPPTLYGWAADMNSQNISQIIEISYGNNSTYDASAKIATTTIVAKLKSPDLLLKKGIAGDHRFAWIIPVSFVDSSYYWFAHVVNKDGTKQQLSMSPRKIDLTKLMFVQPPSQCTLGNAKTSEGTSLMFYSNSRVFGTQRCAQLSAARTCQSDGLFSGDKSFNQTSCTETIIDYVTAFAPSATPKILHVISDGTFNPDTGGYFSYRKEATGVAAKFTPVTNSNSSIRRLLWHSAPLTVGHWFGNPSMGTSSAKITTSADTVTLTAYGASSGGVGVEHILGPRFVSLRVNTAEQMRSVLGGVFYPSPASLPTPGTGGMRAKVEYHPGVKFTSPVRLSDYSQLNLTLDAELAAFTAYPSCVRGTPPNSLGQNCYNPSLHATQFRLSLGDIQWTDPRCTQMIDSDPVCKYYGRSMYTTLNLYDERFEFQTNSFIVDRYTLRPIYQINLQNFLAGKPSVNPYKKVGNRTVASGDLLTYVKEGIFKAEATGSLPPRLLIGGRKETDVEYLAHYSFSGLGIGYENSNLSDSTFKIYNLIINGVRSQAPSTPSCELLITPNIVSKGESAIVSWKTNYADSLTSNIPGKATLPTSGSVKITPTETTPYLLKVNNKIASNVCRSTLVIK